MKRTQRFATLWMACLILCLTVAPGFAAAGPEGPASEPEPAPGEKRYQVRYDHGSANLAAWAPLTIYVSGERIRIYERNQLVHEIAPDTVTSVTHELRTPFHPGRTTERVLNDTIGACSDLLTCAVAGPAGVVGTAGVGVAALFTPKENVVTLNWMENNEPRTLAVKVAWYQRDFILRALSEATGKEASERMPGPPSQSAAVPPAPLAPGGSQSTQAAGSGAPVQPMAQAAYQPEAAAGRTPIRRFEIVLDRSVMVGDVLLEPGFYLVLVQERGDREAVVAFVDDARREQRTVQIAARTLAQMDAAPADAELEPVFTSEEGVTRLAEIRLPGRTLKFVR